MNPQAAEIKLANSSAEIKRCFPVILQLRPHLQSDNFVRQVQQQMQAGYQLAYLQDPEITAVAGFNITMNLAWGKHLYVADLVVDARHRSKGYGEALFTWLVKYAKERNCQRLHLDSGVQRFAAHRFYLRQRMYISSHHFSLILETETQ